LFSEEKHSRKTMPRLQIHLVAFGSRAADIFKFPEDTETHVPVKVDGRNILPGHKKRDATDETQLHLADTFLKESFTYTTSSAITVNCKRIKRGGFVDVRIG